MCLMNQTTKTLLASTHEKKRRKRTRMMTARCTPVRVSKVFKEGGRLGLWQSTDGAAQCSGSNPGPMSSGPRSQEAPWTLRASVSSLASSKCKRPLNTLMALKLAPLFYHLLLLRWLFLSLIASLRKGTGTLTFSSSPHNIQTHHSF